MLPCEEYIEQAYFFRILSERMNEQLPLQALLRQVKHELLATTKMPMAVDYLYAELCHTGTMAPAMRKMAHYFTPFQTYVIDEAEYDRGRFDIATAVRVLQHDAEYRSKSPNPQGGFLYQFETLCRNRMRYDRGLEAIGADPLYDEDWRAWIKEVRREIGLVDLADLIFLKSEEYLKRKRVEEPDFDPTFKPLFGEKEGRIAMVNHMKDPLFLFAALQRHLGYPTVPRAKVVDNTSEIIPQLLRRLERLETRVKIMGDEQREGLDLTKFYVRHDKPT